MIAARDVCIVLVGLPGAGKTTVGSTLARRLGLVFLDSDEEIERLNGTSVASIIDSRGEAAFREIERQAVAQAIAPGRVVALGGGAFVDAGTRELSKMRAISIWLDPPIEVILERLGTSVDRPLLRGSGKFQKLRALIEERCHSYAEADLRIQTASLGEILHTIEQKLRQPRG